MSKVDELAFVSDVSSVGFVEGGKRLFVLTSDQSVYLLEPRAATKAAEAH